MNKKIILANEAATEKEAQCLAQCLLIHQSEFSSFIITLKGEIGAGKTTWVRQLLREFGIQTAIKSPTFSLVESYQTPIFQVHHFDLYRIHEESELEDIGFRDYLSNHVLCCIEWPEHAPNSITQVDIAITLEVHSEGREMTLTALSDAGSMILSCLTGDT